LIQAWLRALLHIGEVIVVSYATHGHGERLIQAGLRALLRLMKSLRSYRHGFTWVSGHCRRRHVPAEMRHVPAEMHHVPAEMRALITLDEVAEDVAVVQAVHRMALPTHVCPCHVAAEMRCITWLCQHTSAPVTWRPR